MKIGKILTTIPIGVWAIGSMVEKALKKKKDTKNTDALDNIEKLYELKKTGAISEEDFNELKERLKEQI